MTASAQIVEAYPKAAPIVDEIIALGAALGVNPFFIANVIWVESNFNPQAYNAKSGASGLIQFTPTTAKGLGTTTDKLRAMTIKEQFRYVSAYFMKYQGKIKTQSDVYLAIFQPGRLGQPLSTPISAVAQEKNPGIRTLQDYVDKANARVRLPTTGSAPQSSAKSGPYLPSAQDIAKVERDQARKRRAKERKRKRKAIVLTVAAVGVALFSLIFTQMKIMERPRNRG